MNAHPKRAPNLLTTHRLTLAHGLSLLIAALILVVSLAGLLFRVDVYPTDELLESFVPTDVVNLFIGLPILLVSMGLARRGRLVGLLLWPGALFFALYTYLIYVLAMPVNLVALLQLALVILAAYTLIGLVACIDAQAIQRQLAGKVPERLAGGVLGGFGLLFFVRAVAVLLQAIVSQESLPGTERALLFVDSLVSPAMFIGGVLLWRKRKLGYIVGLGLLFQASMLFIGLIVLLLVQPVLIDAPLLSGDVLGDILAIAVMSLISFVPLGLYLRGVVSADG